MKRIILAVALVAATVTIALAAGEGASQKWVSMQITNAQLTVDGKIYAQSSNDMAIVDSKIEALRQEMKAAMAKANEVVVQTSATVNAAQAVTNAVEVMKEGSNSSAQYILSTYTM